MRVDFAKVQSVGGVPWKTRWLAWAFSGVVAFGGSLRGGTLLVPCSHAEAPTEKPRAPAAVDSGVRREQGKSPRTQPRPRSAKTAPVAARGSPRARNKDASKAQKKKQRSAQRRSVLLARGPARFDRHAPRPRRPHAAPRAARKPAAEAHDEQALDAAASPDEACHLQLRKAGVSFVKLAIDKVPGVGLPIRLTGSVVGVEIRGTGKNRVTHSLDCRLGLALVRWAPQLSAAGVVRLDHYSIYRPDAEVGTTQKTSGHARALAIDAARFHLRDGRVLTVLETWTDKTKGADPCRPRSQQSEDERLLRELVCDAARRGIFQTIVTPHHNPEHDNHVHLEISASFAPTWIH
jgi:hypothetical protein